MEASNYETMRRRALQLIRIWSWVERVDNMSVDDPDLSLLNCSVMHLLNSSEENRNSLTSKNRPKVDPSSRAVQQTIILKMLGCAAFDSDLRRAARCVCGWTLLKDSLDSGSSFYMQHFAELNDLVEEYEKYDTFERACALALWHGDLGLAVAILRRTMDVNESRKAARMESGSNVEYNNAHAAGIHEDDGGEDGSYFPHLGEDYVRVIPLVAMCIAGFSAVSSSKNQFNNSSASENAALWSSMCEHVISQVSKIKDRSTSGYLAAACQFLLCVLKSQSHSHQRATDVFRMILENDKDVALEDKVAFACYRCYLPNDELIAYLHNQQTRCRDRYDIEGILLVGLSPLLESVTPPSSSFVLSSNDNSCSGFELVQKYLDNTCGIQTVALLVSRLPQALAATPSRDYSLEGEWLMCYRKLLNSWKLYMERASLDVDLGRRQRQIRTVVAASASNARKTSQQSSTSQSGTSVSSDSKFVYPLPEHMEEEQSFMCLKCTYCSVPLPVDPMDKKHVGSSWMRKQRPIMSCCPNCKRQLPRCYVCLFFTGVLNPQMELKVIAKRREIEHNTAVALNSIATGSTLTDFGIHVHDKSSAINNVENNLFEMGKWFMWCQKCKHGGHAGCLEGWFTTRVACGVNGCTCVCSI